MKKIFYIVFFTFSSLSFSQDISCSELLDFVKQNGYSSGSVDSFTMQSSWLHRVTQYSYDSMNFVVAEIKENEYSFNTKKYIFCGVPSYNWSQFRFGGYGMSNSYGERFHDLIFPYKCDCY